MMTENGDSHESRKDSVIKPTPATAVVTVHPVTIEHRAYFSRDHLFGARHFVELTHNIEDNIEDAKTEGRPSNFEKNRAYVINAILSSVAYMEAAINEVFQDAVDEEENYLSSLSKDSKALMKEAWEKNEKTFGLLGKFQLALFCTRQSLFDKGLQPYQRAQLVVLLRNALVHAKPTSHIGGEEEKHDVAKNLKAEHFAPNPFVGPHTSNPFFPDKCLGHGCAEWALNSCEEFVGEFFRKMALNPPYRSSA